MFLIRFDTVWKRCITKVAGFGQLPGCSVVKCLSVLVTVWVYASKDLNILIALAHLKSYVQAILRAKICGLAVYTRQPCVMIKHNLS